MGKGDLGRCEKTERETFSSAMYDIVRSIGFLREITSVESFNGRKQSSAEGDSIRCSSEQGHVLCSATRKYR